MSDPTQQAAPPPAPSVWGTLRNPSFRALWRSGGIYFIGNAMQTMAAAWMMVEMTGSSFLAALVQTAVFLPMFLLALPAGVLSDITDRRRLILGSLYTQAATVALLAVLSLAGWAGPAALLFFVFVAGCCTALLSPAWNSAIGDSIPRARAAAGHHAGLHRLQRGTGPGAGFGGAGVCLARRCVELRHCRGGHLGHDPGHPCLAAQPAPALAVAG